jgi:hypothetical protein
MSWQIVVKRLPGIVKNNRIAWKIIFFKRLGRVKLSGYCETGICKALTTK